MQVLAEMGKIYPVSQISEMNQNTICIQMVVMSFLINVRL